MRSRHRSFSTFSSLAVTCGMVTVMMATVVVPNGIAVAATPPGVVAKVFVFAGQSNMGGYGVPSELAPQDRLPDANVLVLTQYGPSAGTFEPYAPGRENQFGNNNTAFGPELSAIKSIAANTGETVYIVKVSSGGTSLARDWTSRNGTERGAGPWYNLMIGQTKLALNKLRAQGIRPSVAGFFWMQGEADTFVYPDSFARYGVSSSDAAAVAYEGRLRDLIADIRVAFDNAAMPFVMGETSDQPAPFGDARQGFASVVRAAQQKVAQTEPWVFTASATDLPKLPDNVHLGGQALRTLGSRMAAGWSSLVHNGGFEADGQWAPNPNRWETWAEDTANAAASYSESLPISGSGFIAHSGRFHGTHWAAKPYRVYTYQHLKGLAPGTYSVSAWVQTAGGQRAAVFDIHGHGAPAQSMSLLTPTLTQGTWQKVLIASVPVTSGEATIGFWSDAPANSWMHFDDIDLKLLAL
jgi:Carbohydrate esterase, sialic acid-specific acetylesterase